MTDQAFHIDAVSQASRRLDLHESRITQLETLAAVATERDRQIREDLKSINSGIQWIGRTFIAAIVLAAAGFVVSGGLNVIP